MTRRSCFARIVLTLLLGLRGAASTNDPLARKLSRQDSLKWQKMVGGDDGLRRLAGSSTSPMLPWEAFVKEALEEARTEKMWLDSDSPAYATMSRVVVQLAKLEDVPRTLFQCTNVKREAAAASAVQHALDIFLPPRERLDSTELFEAVAALERDVGLFLDALRSRSPRCRFAEKVLDNEVLKKQAEEAHQETLWSVPGSNREAFAFEVERSLRDILAIPLTLRWKSSLFEAFRMVYAVREAFRQLNLKDSSPDRRLSHDVEVFTAHAHRGGRAEEFSDA